MKRRVRQRLALCAVLLLVSGIEGGAFTLIGPLNPGTAINANYYTFSPAPVGAPVPPGGTVDQGFVNHVDPMGWPVPIKEFYRWNWPELTYAFDSTFVRYFGHNGMQAIHNAFEVLNDYYDPQDNVYSGVSSMDLIREYDQHFSTWKFNPSANVNNIYDMETMVLGLLVNHLGLGNPHRHCFTIRDIINYTAAAAAATGNFNVAIRNYDPFTYHPSTIINGVNYSYFITSNPAYNGGAAQFPTTFDAIEYAISSDHEYSAVAGIRDVINFGGLPWPMIAPTVFRTPGVYFAPDNALNKPAPLNVTRQVRSQPRHTLTFDDAGGLRYLYRTNNIVWETLDATVTLVQAANMNPQPTAGNQQSVPPNSPFSTPSPRTIVGMVAQNFTPVQPGGQFRPQPNTIVRAALRGGIDKIKFNYLAYDSLLGTAYQTNITVWQDVFVQNALPTDITPASPPYFSQMVARTTTIPDIVFIADDLGVAGNVLPVIQIPSPGTDWDTTMIVNNTQQGVAGVMLGPGVILPPANASIQYFFTTRAPLTTVIWAGEPGIEGNFITQFQWGWITNTGPNDYIQFPKVDITQAEAITGPAGTLAKITALTVYDGLNEAFRSSPFDIDRSRDTITIYGQRLDTVTSIKVLDHNTTINGVYQTLQTIDTRRYIMSDQQIVLPPGTLDNTTVSPTSDVWYRRIALVNSKGESASEFIYKVSDGRPLVTSTQRDGLPLNTTKSLIIQGNGFKFSSGNVNQVWFFSDNNVSNYNLDPNSGTGVFPQPIAVLDINASNTAFVPPSGVSLSYAEIVVSDSMIYLPPHLLSDGNYTFTTLGFGTIGQGATMGRSEGNNTDVATDMFTRHIRLAFNPAVNGLPNANVIMSPPRASAQAYSHIGVGGDRNSSASGNSPTLPTITDVFTVATIPGLPVSAADANRTWVRGDDADVLTIRGTGLDLALSIEFVDGAGNSILSTDANGLPPQPISLRDAVEPSVTAPGVTIVDFPALGSDGYEIRIAPVTFGMNGNPLFDSAAGTNINQLRVAVIRTPFGTTIAPLTKFLMIQ